MGTYISKIYMKRAYTCFLFAVIALYYLGPMASASLAQKTTPPATHAQTSTPAPSSDPWQELEPGLHLGIFSLAKHPNTDIVALRINPEYFTFDVFSIGDTQAQSPQQEHISMTQSSSDDQTQNALPTFPPQTLEQWANQHNLVAAINASMYLPDGKTSTGYMRKGEYINNKHLAKGYGAFFLANPIPKYASTLPKACLIGRDQENFKDALSYYSTVIQNFRMIDGKGQILWPQKSQKHSIAAVGQNSSGEIVFLHVRKGMTAHDFVTSILELPLHMQSLMYVEGGVQAGLIVRHPQKNIFWGGEHASQIFTGTMAVALPNIIGVYRKNP